MGQKTSEYDPKNPPTIQKTPQNIPKHVKIYQLQYKKSPKKSGKSFKIHEKSPKTRNAPKIVNKNHHPISTIPKRNEMK